MGQGRTAEGEYDDEDGESALEFAHRDSPSRRSRSGPIAGRACALEAAGQLVQELLPPLAVVVAAPPLAATPVSAGIEKYVLAQASGVPLAIVASLVRVTVKLLVLAATVIGEVRVCVDPELLVAKFQPTRLVLEEQPATPELRALSE
ncbi:MAG: hypothetical protein QOK42_2739 [Frankiaceae bacterium]|nr:hypothetical protein [Frankiaceae bacterium]